MERFLAWKMRGCGLLLGEGGDVVIVIVWYCGVRSCLRLRRLLNREEVLGSSG